MFLLLLVNCFRFGFVDVSYSLPLLFSYFYYIYYSLIFGMMTNFSVLFGFIFLFCVSVYCRFSSCGFHEVLL